MNPQNTTDHINNNVKQEIFISYLDAINYIPHNRILCNNIAEIDSSIWENARFSVYDEEEDYYTEIFQYFITDFNLNDIEYLEKKFPSLKFSYSDKLDAFILCVDHFGTMWAGVPCEVCDEELKSDIIASPERWEYVNTCHLYKRIK